MTNNFEEPNDDFLEPEHGAPESARPGIAGNLAEAWRSRPLFKFMVLIVAVFAVSVAAVNFFGGNAATNDVARLGRPPNLKEAPGGVVSPYMKQQTELANKERTDQALASGGSALPTPIGQTADIGGFGGTDKKDDPLNELRVETEKLKAQLQQQQAQQQQQQIQQARQTPQQQQQQQQQFDNTLAEAMQRQMQQLLEGWSPKGIKSVTVIKADDLKAAEVKAQDAAASGAAPAATPASATTPPKAIVNAGTVSYAQLLTEANSDVPGPILAQIVSGPLAGARAVGAFQVAEGYEKYLVLRFSLADKKGTDYHINAIALDPDTTLGGMATEVDERYFARVVLPAAAGFLQGMGQALSQGDSSITTNGSTTITTQASNGYKQGIYNGLGQASNTMGQFFQDQANLTKPLVRVAAGTPMGMFFVAPVFDPSAENGAAQQPYGNGMNGVNGYYGNGNYGYPNGGYPNGNYPGTTINGYGGSYSQALAASGAPYPNYANPGYGYNSSNRYAPTSMGLGGVSQFSPYTTQGFGQ